jgi:hypothetical protein
MNRKHTIAFALLTVVAGCAAQTDDSTGQGSSEAVTSHYSTPDPYNIWLKDVDLSKLTIGEENVLPNEEELFRGFVDVVKTIQEGTATKYGKKQRGFHAKPHACVEGELTINVPSDLRAAKVGLFAKDASYPVWIRYSNGVGFSQSDRKGDVRGFAMKVMKVPGKKILPGQEDAVTQDFLMTNGAITPAADSKAFVAFGQGLYEAGLSNDGTVLGAVEAMVKSGAFLLKPEQTRVRNFLLKGVLPKTLTHGSMLGEQFWTGGAFALGVDGSGKAKNAAKMTAIPGILGADGSCSPHNRLPNVLDDDYFRTDVKQRMKAGKTCIDIRIQLQKDPKKQLIEDTSVEWMESDTPFISVGTVVIPQTDLDGDPKAQARETFCNSLGYTPWHSLVEHRPLGNIMRARRPVYEASREFRGGAGEPTGDETP